jgi:uncharacterized protein (TIGR02444 family)
MLLLPAATRQPEPLKGGMCAIFIVWTRHHPQSRDRAAVPASTKTTASAGPAVAMLGWRMAESGNPFWSFSLALYGRPGVAPALIGLQDRLGLDVNMLLFCCWTGTVGRPLSPADIAAVEHIAEPWQAEVVRPLRALRRRLKGGFADLPAAAVEAYRKRINELEIAGERLAQDAMAGLLPATPALPPSAALVAGNLTAYLRARRVVVGTADEGDLAAVLGGCFPDASLEELRFTSA